MTQTIENYLTGLNDEEFTALAPLLEFEGITMRKDWNRQQAINSIASQMRAGFAGGGCFDHFIINYLADADEA